MQDRIEITDIYETLTVEYVPLSDVLYDHNWTWRTVGEQAMIAKICDVPYIEVDRRLWISEYHVELIPVRPRPATTTPTFTADDARVKAFAAEMQKRLDEFMKTGV